jgi:hypothetical protein
VQIDKLAATDLSKMDGYVTGISNIGNISATTLGTPFASISTPRFWGVEVAAHF